MRTTISNRIRIDDPSPEVKAWAKEHMELPNPEYIKRERAGRWLGRTPKVLRLYERDGNALVLPFGVCREIMPMLQGTGIECDFRQDEEIGYTGTDVPLYGYQADACMATVRGKYGILKAPTGSGKTQMGIAIIKAYRRRALWLCHTQDLLKQSRDRALQYIDPEWIGTITEGKVNIGKGVTFATVQTMANLELQQYRDCWDVVIVDECHRVATSATTFTRYEKVLNHLAARHKYGLSATLERSDGLIRATFALIGNVVHEIPAGAVSGRVMNVKVRREDTGIEYSEDCLNDDGTIDYVKLIEYLTTDRERNKLIARAIMDQKGHSCLILSDRLAQLETIRNMLPYEMQEKSAFINGKMTSKAARAEREQALEDMRTGEKRYLFASYSLSKEGLDIPRLDRLFLASPVKFSSVITQAVGRIRRTFEGKKTPVVLDFVDENIGFCMRAYKERCRSYRKMGAEILEGFLE